MTNERPAAPAARGSEDPDPGAEAIDVFTSGQILDYVRYEAARRDPRSAHLYRKMRAGRIKDGIDVAQQLLAAHLALFRGHGRGGRREHRAAIDGILASTNDASLVLGLVWLEAALGLLPASPPRHGD
jgi:hypothetical protein